MSNNYNKLLGVVHRVNNFFGYIDNFDILISAIMKEVAQAMAAEACSIAIYDKNSKDLVFMYTLGEKSSTVKQMRIKIGEGIIGYAAKKRIAINIKDVSLDKRFMASVDRKTGFCTRSVVAVPLIYSKELIGAIEVINKKRGSFTAEDVNLLEFIAGQAAISIENAKLYSKLKQKHSDLVQKHNKIVEARKKIMVMERLSTIGNMLGGIVHDLRNPMSNIKLVTDYIRLSGKQYFSEKEKEEYCNTISGEIERMNSMINDLLEFTKGQTNLSKTTIAFADFIDEILVYFKSEFKDSNIDLVVKSDYTGNVNIDRLKMQRVIFNLVSNAKDALPHGGLIKIESFSRDNRLYIKVSDTGCGISSAITKKLFEPFVTYGKSHGVGLGLAIVKMIVESHDGSITVVSNPPKTGEFSTVFIISLPL